MARAGAAGGNNLPRKGVVLLGPATGARGAAALPTPGGRGSRKEPLPHLLPEGAGRRVPAAGARRGPRRRRSPRGSGRRNGSARWGEQNHPGETLFPLQGGRLTDPLAGSSTPIRGENGTEISENSGYRFRFAPTVSIGIGNCRYRKWKR